MLGKLCGIRLSACGGPQGGTPSTRLPVCLQSPRVGVLGCGLAPCETPQWRGWRPGPAAGARAQPRRHPKKKPRAGYLGALALREVAVGGGLTARMLSVLASILAISDPNVHMYFRFLSTLFSSLPRLSLRSLPLPMPEKAVRQVTAGLANAPSVPA